MPPLNAQACERLFKELQEACGRVTDATFRADNDNLQTAAYNYAADIELWIEILDGRPEAKLYELGVREYQLALLALVQGQYRQAFMGLRLFFELVLSGVLFSANELHCRGWLKGNRDTNWNSIVHSDTGIFSIDFGRTFFEEVAGLGKEYRSISEKVYRECSEYVHGNALTHHLLPQEVQFNEASFRSWHEKAKNMRLVVSFALAARYLKLFPQTTRNKFENFVQDHLAHIEQIRSLFDALGER